MAQVMKKNLRGKSGNVLKDALRIVAKKHIANLGVKTLVEEESNISITTS